MKVLRFWLVNFLIFGFFSILFADDFSDAENAYKNKSYSKEIVEIFDKACGEKFLRACIYLGSMYSNGQGIEKSYSKAINYFLKACDQGAPVGCSVVGDMYTAG